MKLLQHAKSEIKSICYNLERSIKGHDVHINLTDVINEVEVIAHIQIYCRIKIREKFAPLIMHF